MEGDISFTAASMGGIATDSHCSAVRSELLYIGVDNLYIPRPHKLRYSLVSERSVVTTCSPRWMFKAASLIETL